MKKKIKVEANILSENDKLAGKIRRGLMKNGVVAINVMASPGAGKTSLIVETIRRLKNKYKIAVVDGDVSDIDVERLKAEGVPVELANTGGACHLDAVMVEKAVKKLNLATVELLIIENVGNLICPANFDVGAEANVVIASVPEGSDKPYKYPGMFVGADVVVVNKIDYAEVEEFDRKYFKVGLKRVNDRAQVIELSCKTGEGVGKWIEWLEREMKYHRRREP